MTRAELVAQIKAKKSFLCVGLDTALDKIPKHLLDAEDPIFEFNKQIPCAFCEFRRKGRAGCNHGLILVHLIVLL